ncbi:hypothetical protein LIER_34270 [Lithospermum erythrorhizon]|uniref:Uncharacterized protein n=1 Tax=Lithospermum erythrorhizon TaxID=34254 RepID=A0AAV3S0H6_LITER
MSMVEDLIMIRMQMNRDKAAKWDGKLCPKPRAKLVKCVKDATRCMPMKCVIGHTFKSTQVDQQTSRGKVQVSKIQKYLYKTCKGPGHNSRICKRRKTNEPAPNMPSQQQESVLEMYNFSQSSTQNSQVPPLKTRTR